MAALSSPNPWRSPGTQAAAPSEVSWGRARSAGGSKQSLASTWGSVEQRSYVPPFWGHTYLCWSSGIFMPRGFTKLLLKLGVSGRRGQPACPSSEGRGAELEGHGAASPWRASTSHVRNLFWVVWRRFVSQILPHQCPHHWHRLFAWDAVMLREHTVLVHQEPPCQHPDFKLLNWKKQVIPALDTRSQSSNAFQSWTSCWELLRIPGKEIWWVHFLTKSNWSNSFNTNGEGNRQLSNGVFNCDSFSFPKKH